MAQFEQLTCAALVSAMAFVFTASAASQRNNAGPVDKRPLTPATLPCGDPVGFQVLLDRAGFSPGQIDSTPGPNFSRAIKAFQEARKVQVTGEADCATWEALVGKAAQEVIVSYTISEADVKGPFTKHIPRSLPEQASLAALGYTSAIEKLAEKFHSTPALLQQLNHGGRFAAGVDIRVPGVEPFDWDAPTPMPDPAADVTVKVTRDESALRVTRGDGTLVFFAPVTTGSEHDPLPQGDWTVTSISWKPPFNYNPDLFWDAKATDRKAQIKPGPNNPVGIVWVDLSLEHYGIHGTPEPSRIAQTESHGCVRLTNWDAARVASLVKPGTAVQFR